MFFKNILKKIFKAKNRIVVYTAIFGGKDNLKEPLYKIKNADLICFTDNIDFKSDSYKIIIRQGTHQDPNLSAKKYKLLGDPFLDKYKYSIWADGNQLLKFKDAKVLVNSYLRYNNLALFAHPDGRDCIYDECDFLVENNHIFNFDYPEKMINQIIKYKKEGMPKHAGLIAGGFIIRKIHSTKVKKIMNLWWKEVTNHSRRDQLSFNYVIWKLREKYGVIQGSYWDNEYMNALGAHLKR